MTGSKQSEQIRPRIGNFRQKKYSAEDGIDGTIGLFRRNSVCSAEHKTIGIPFRTVPTEEKNARNSVPWNKKRSKLSELRSEPFRGTENSQNSVPNRSAEEKNARNSDPWKKVEAISRNSVPKHVYIVYNKLKNFNRILHLVFIQRDYKCYPLLVEFDY